MRQYSEFTPKTIMLATDLSPASYGALGYARVLAKRFSAKILLTHVVDTALLPVEERPDPSLLIDRAEKELQGRIPALAEEFIESRVIVRQGGIRETILNLIGERNVDLLVLGTKGRTFKPGEKLGSVAERLLRAMPCPVLSVGGKARTDAFDRMHDNKILVPTDFSKASQAAIEYAACLAHCLHGRLYLLHCENRGAASPSTNFARQTGRFEAFTRRAKDRSLIAEYMTCIGSPADRIVAAAAEKDIDLLVMRVHEGDQPGGGRLHGVVYDVIRSARCPVFTLFAPSMREEAGDGEYWPPD